MLSLITSLTILAVSLTTDAQLSQQHFLTDKRILTPQIDQFIEGTLSSWNSPGGVSVAVVQLDKLDGLWTAETKGYGIANLAENKPVTEDSLFCIASNSKLFTTLATGILISNKTISTPITWDTKIKSILPDLWELQDRVATSESTITDAMSHRTGLPRHDLMYTRNDTTISILERLRHLKPSSGFRETWQYNNNMYTLLSYIPTALIPSHPPFARYVQDHIFSPLGLDSTTYSPRVAKESGNLADPMAREGVNKTEDIFGKGKPRAMRFPGWFLNEEKDGSFKSGAGGVIMNAKDAATWLQVLLLEGKNPKTSEQVIPSDVIRKVASGIMVQNGEPTFTELSPVVYGGGQSRGVYRGHNYIEHGGATTGYRTQITRFPDLKLGIAVFSNDDDHGSAFIEVIKYRIIDAALSLPALDWDTRFKSRIRKSYEKYSSQKVARPSNPTPPPAPFQSLAGTYENWGYGVIELCLLGAPTHSTSCQDIVDELPTVLPGAVDRTIPTLIARWDRFWSTHIKLEHFDGPFFNLSILESRPTDNKMDPYWIGEPWADSIYTVEIVATHDRARGFGFFGGFWGAGTGVKASAEGSLRETAEVFFDKV